MQDVSDGYLDAIVAPERRIVSRVLVTFIDNETIGKAIVVTAGESDADLLPASNVVDTKTSVRKFAFADHYDETDAQDRARVFPASDLYPMTNDGGWFGDTLSDVDGDISGGEAIELDYGASPVDVFSLGWWADEYLGRPVDFTVETYNGSSWTTRATITGYAQNDWSLGFDSAISIYKLKITITKVDHGYSYAKLLEVEAGMTVDLSDRVISWEILKEREHQNGSTPVGNISANQLALQLDNSDGVFFRKSGSLYAPYLIANRKIRVYCGVRLDDETDEYVAQGVFYTRAWKSDEGSIETSVTAWDRSKRLSEEEYQTSVVVEGSTISDLVNLLADAFGLGVAEMVIDPAADEIVDYAWFTPASYWSHLRDLAIAAGGVIYFDELNRLVFESLDYLAGKTTSVVTLTDLDSIINASESWEQDNMRNHVVVPVRPLTPDTEQEIYRLTESISVPAGGTKGITLFYSKSPCISVQTPVVTGGAHISIDSWTAYAWGGYLVLANSGGAAENVTIISVDGQPLIELGGIEAESENPILILLNGRRTYRAPNEAARFIQSLSTAEELAPDLLAALQDPSSERVVRMRGRPELQLGDRCTIQDTKLSLNGDYWLTRMRLTYSGGLDMEATILEVPGD